MQTFETTKIKKRYGSFVLAATAYIAGILLFSFWSYSAHRNALLKHTGQSLADAAFSIQEILKEDLDSLPADNRLAAPASLAGKRKSLYQIARHGNFCSLGAVSINHRKIEILVSASGEPAAVPELSETKQLTLSTELKQHLLRMAAGGNDHTEQLDDLPDDSSRYAISYRAQEKGRGIAFVVVQESEIIEKALADQALRLAAAGFGMLLLAIPLITLFGRTQKQASAELEQLNAQLQLDVELQKTREIELEEAISDLERFNAVSAGRETRIIELKAEVNELLEAMKREKRYNIDRID